MAVQVGKAVRSTIVGLVAPPGFGKTVDEGYSFPAGLFNAPPGALKPIKAVCGYDPEPRRLDVSTFSECGDLVGTVVKQGFPSLVFDDASYTAERTEAAIEAAHKGNKNRFAKFGDLRDAMIDFRDKVRYAQLPFVVLAFWEQGPRVETVNGETVVYKGGPKLPGKNMPEMYAGLMDVLLLAGTEPSRTPWPKTWRNDPANQHYVMKDRHNAAPPKGPMNIGEILRHAIFLGQADFTEVPRHPALDWQEAVVEKLANALLDGATPESIVDLARTKLREKHNASDRIIRWTLRDAFDRAELRRLTAEQDMLSAFIPKVVTATDPNSDL